MRHLRLITLGAAVLGLVALADAAHASPITYSFSSGSLTLTADIGTLDYLPAGASMSLTSGDLILDTVAADIPGFSFAAAGPSSFVLQNQSASGGFNLSGITLTLSDLLATNDPTTYQTYSFTGAGSTSNPYLYTVGTVDGSGDYALSGSVTKGTTSFSKTAPSLSGSIILSDAGGQEDLSLMGVTIGTVTIQGQTVTVKGDFTFDGIAPVPLPPAWWTLASGIGLLVLVRRRARG